MRVPPAAVNSCDEACEGSDLDRLHQPDGPCRACSQVCGRRLPLVVGPRRHLPALALELAHCHGSAAGLLSAPGGTAAFRPGSWAGQRGALSLAAGPEGGSGVAPWPFASLASQRSSQPSRLIAAAPLVEPGPRAGFPDISGPSVLSGARPGGIDQTGTTRPRLRDGRSVARPPGDTQGLRVGHSRARASGPRPRVRYALVPAFRRDDAIKAHDVVECVLAGNDPERAPQRIEALEAGGV